MAPRITLQTLALLAVLLSEPAAEHYGFDLADRAGLKTGTLYPLLARLEQAGWLDSRWEEIEPRAAGRPRRRLYVLTADGLASAREALAEHLERVAPGWRDQPAPSVPSMPPKLRPAA